MTEKIIQGQPDVWTPPFPQSPFPRPFPYPDELLRDMLGFWGKVAIAVAVGVAVVIAGGMSDK